MARQGLKKTRVPDLGPHLDSFPPDGDRDRETYALTEPQFNNIIRLVRMAPHETVKQLVFVLRGDKEQPGYLELLGVKRDLSKAVAKIPDGSDQWNARAVYEWFEKLKPNFRKAVAQAVAIEATAIARVGS